MPKYKTGQYLVCSRRSDRGDGAEQRNKQKKKKKKKGGGGGRGGLGVRARDRL